MATLLYRLGSTAYRRWPVFIAAWLVALIGFGTLATAISRPMVDTFSIPGIASLEAQETQQELFPEAAESENLATATVVVAAPESATLSDPEYADAVEALVAELQALPQTDEASRATIVNPVLAAAGQSEQITEAAKQNGTPAEVAEANAAALSPLSADGRVGTITFNFAVDSPADVEESTKQALESDLETAREAGLTAEFAGSALQEMPETGGKSELIGVAVALVVLVITFGSLIAAGLPIITAFAGVGMGLLGVTAMTAFTDLGTTTPMLASMIGLAVGIDYSLFILARYRSELAAIAGVQTKAAQKEARADAMGRAVGTAGSAVVFAGLTVLIALSALSVVGIPFLTSMGLAAAGTVFFAVLVALTLLPAVLGAFGGKAFGGRVRRRTPRTDEEGQLLNNGTRWARMIGRKPVAVLLLGVIGLGALAIPASGLRLALPTDATAPTDTTQRQASDLITDAFGEGRNGPLLVVVDGRGLDPQKAPEQFGAVAAWAAGLDDVANAQIVGVNEAGIGATVLVTPEGGPNDESTQVLLDALRDGAGDIEASTGTEIGVTGVTAIQADVSQRLTEALPLFLAVVIGLAFVLLMVVFRSILVPLTATLGFLLSVLATLGATVLVFSDGLFGLFEGQPLVSFMPVILVGLVFGLAMDYQVFLVSRMREAYVHGVPAKEAVVHGFRHGARVVSAAAVIMISVFGAFVLQDNALIQSMGFALAFAVFIDAFVVRMTLIPAIMYLLGDKAWWLPGWLDRLLPNVDVEGEALAEQVVEDDERPLQPV